MDQDILNRLSARPRELLDLVAAGTTTSKALAAKTELNPGSIGTTLQAAVKHLGVKDRVAAAERFRALTENSQPPSQLRISPLSTPLETGPSHEAGAARRVFQVIIDFLRGPQLGGDRHSLAWDEIALQILRVAVIGMVTVIALVLLVLGFFKTFG